MLKPSFRAAVLTLALLTAISYTGAVTATEAQASGVSSDVTACPEVVIMGARGSGEAQGSNQGFGSTAWPFVSGVENSLRIDRYYRSITHEAVIYPAIKVDDLRHPPFGYRKSVDIGSRALVNLVDKWYARCKKQVQPWEAAQFMLVGYSQGAEVVDNALELMVKEKDPALRLVQDAAVFGDPRRADANGRLPFEVGYTQGSHQGVAAFWGLDKALERDPYGADPLGYSAEPVLNALGSGGFRSYCAKGDGVCAFPNAFGPHFTYPRTFVPEAVKHSVSTVATLRCMRAGGEC